MVSRGSLSTTGLDSRVLRWVRSQTADPAWFFSTRTGGCVPLSEVVGLSRGTQEPWKSATTRPWCSSTRTVRSSGGRRDAFEVLGAGRLGWTIETSLLLGELLKGGIIPLRGTCCRWAQAQPSLVW